MGALGETYHRNRSVNQPTGGLKGAASRFGRNELGIQNSHSENFLPPVNHGDVALQTLQTLERRR